MIVHIGLWTSLPSLALVMHCGQHAFPGNMPWRSPEGATMVLRDHFDDQTRLPARASALVRIMAMPPVFSG